MSPSPIFFSAPLRRAGTLAALTVLSTLPAAALAQSAGPSLPLMIGQGAGGTSYSVPIQTLLFFTALASCRPCCC